MYPGSVSLNNLEVCPVPNAPNQALVMIDPMYNNQDPITLFTQDSLSKSLLVVPNHRDACLRNAVNSPWFAR